MLRLTDRLPGRRAFITGAASGLGQALALQLAADGWTLGAADRDAEALATACAAIEAAGGHAVPYVFDVGDAEAFQAAADAFVAAHGGVDLVVNNAGIAVAGAFEAVSLADWDAAVAVNLMGVVYGGRVFLPALRASQGVLLNIASAAAIAAGPFMTAYNATKAGVLALSETLHSELFDDRVQVSVALLTFFQTNIGKSQRGDPAQQPITERLLRRSNLSADTVAAAILKQVGKGRLHVFYPRQARMLWHFKRLLPSQYLRSMVKVRRRTEQYLARQTKPSPAETATPAPSEAE